MKCLCCGEGFCRTGLYIDDELYAKLYGEGKPDDLGSPIPESLRSKLTFVRGRNIRRGNFSCSYNGVSYGRIDFFDYGMYEKGVVFSLNGETFIPIADNNVKKPSLLKSKDSNKDSSLEQKPKGKNTEQEAMNTLQILAFCEAVNEDVINKNMSIPKAIEECRRKLEDTFRLNEGYIGLIAAYVHKNITPEICLWVLSSYLYRLAGGPEGMPIYMYLVGGYNMYVLFKLHDSKELESNLYMAKHVHLAKVSDKEFTTYITSNKTVFDLYVDNMCIELSEDEKAKLLRVI